MDRAALDLLDEAIDIATAGGAFTLPYFRSADLVVDGKADGTEVTAADRGAESLIRDRIVAAFPNDSVLGEEHGTIDRDSGRTWIIDPIDGTFGFVRGVPFYATLLALVDGDGPLLGVIHLPALGQTIAAARGEGCFADGSRCQVAGRSTVAGALINSSDWNATSEAQFGALLGADAHMRTWGDAYGYAMVARGEAEAMIDPICSAWDLAPMPVIISEAGGTFTALDGSPRFDAGHGVATNGAIHAELLDLLSPGRSHG